MNPVFGGWAGNLTHTFILRLIEKCLGKLVPNEENNFFRPPPSNSHLQVEVGMRGLPPKVILSSPHFHFGPFPLPLFNFPFSNKFSSKSTPKNSGGGSLIHTNHMQLTVYEILAHIKTEAHHQARCQ